MEKTVKIKDSGREKDSLLGGAVALTASVIIVKIIGFLYKLPLSHILGDEGMGYFNSAYTVYTLFYIISTAGIPKSISILTAKAQAENNGTENLIFASAFKALTIFGLFLTLILTLFFKRLCICYRKHEIHAFHPFYRSLGAFCCRIGSASRISWRQNGFCSYCNIRAYRRIV